MIYDTYLQKLLCEGNVNTAYIGTNTYEIAIPSTDIESPPTFITKSVLILESDDGIRYSITEEQLEIKKDAVLNKYPNLEQTIMSNYNTLKEKMEVSE